MLRPFAVLAALVLVSCSKPTPAATALSAFLEQIARNNHRGVADSLASGSKLNERFTGELVEGEVEVFPPAMIGTYDWSKSKVVKETVRPTGEHEIEMVLDVCLRGENNACSRPNTYSFVAVMVNEEGAWSVQSASCAEKNIVR